MVSPGGGGVTEGDRGADRQTLHLTQCPIVKLGVTIWLLSIALLIEAEKIAQNQTPKNSRTAEVNGGNERRRYPTMSEVNGKTLSISFRIDEGVIEHNNRIIIAKM